MADKAMIPRRRAAALGSSVSVGDQGGAAQIRLSGEEDPAATPAGGRACG